jgi:hypothetical protein
VLRVTTDDLERGVYLPAVWRHTLFHGNLFRIRKNAAVTARRRTARAMIPVGEPAADAPAVNTAAQARLAREWEAELQRTIAELRTTTSDLEVARSTVADMERSAFWKARRIWVRLAAIFGSRRGDVPATAHARSAAPGPGTPA